MFARLSVSLLACLIATSFVATAADSANKQADWENERVIGINKESGRVFSLPFADRSQAMEKRWQESSNVKLLNGTWKFHYAKRHDLRPTDFYQEAFDVSDWSDIKVPSSWQTLGFGAPLYVNTRYPFHRDLPTVTGEPPEHYTAFEYRNPVGSYRRNFALPSDCSGGEVFIHFGGVESAFYLWVNGEQVGNSEAVCPGEGPGRFSWASTCAVNRMRSEQDAQ
ncbi:Beta-galactosidase [Planctomycetes bacterium CA13]|uniref:beta-galactosidase n=1 Tax=Novipirellula herctigrandis TaxID=2527986 RepID=A0A5C5YYR0_9BACT|nr:Beta-galactosidase [Planctomycetes bacterium CA13]